MMAVGGCGSEAVLSWWHTHAARRRHGAQPFAGKPGFPQRVQIALTALGDKCLIVAFAQQGNALMAFSISQRVALYVPA
jgi:hypothetical protein